MNEIDEIRMSTAGVGNESDDDVLNFRVSDLSETQDIILSLAFIPSAFLSLLGSSLIIYLVCFKSKRDRPDTVYKRIIVAMSIYDLVISLNFFLQPFLLPEDTSPRIWASGSDASCAVVGFLSQFGTAAIWYNGWLCFYFMLTVCYNVSEQWMAKWLEPWIHVTSICYSFATATLGLAMGFYGENELGPGCWLNEIPRGCATTKDMEAEVPSAPKCLTMMVGIAFAGGVFMVCFVAVIINNLLIFLHVRKTLQAPQRRCSNQFSDSFRNTIRSRKRLVMVAVQCLCYVLAFYFSYIWLIIVRFMEGSGYPASEESKIFWLLLCQCFCTPLQGFFNLFIYTRPRFLQAKEEFPAESRWWALRRALFGEQVQPTTSTVPSSSVKHHGHGCIANDPSSSDSSRMSAKEDRKVAEEPLYLQSTDTSRTMTSSELLRMPTENEVAHHVVDDSPSNESNGVQQDDSVSVIDRREAFQGTKTHANDEAVRGAATPAIEDSAHSSDG